MQSGQITFYKIRDNKFQLDLTITLRLYLAIFYKYVLLIVRIIVTCNNYITILINKLTINIYFFYQKKNI